jgi:hypothetical protein
VKELHKDLLDSVIVVSSNQPGMGKTHYIQEKLGIHKKKSKNYQKFGSGNTTIRPLQISINGRTDLTKSLESEPKIADKLDKGADIYIQVTPNTSDGTVLEGIDDFIFMLSILRIYPYLDSFILLDQKHRTEQRPVPQKSMPQNSNYNSNTQNSNYNSNTQNSNYNSNTQNSNYNSNTQNSNYNSNTQNSNYNSNNRGGYGPPKNQPQYKKVHIYENRKIYIEIGNSFTKEVKESITSLELFKRSSHHIINFDIKSIDLGNSPKSAVQMC